MAETEKTYWNGEETPCRIVHVVVGPSPEDTWWCAGMVGTTREAVRVDYPGGGPFYLDNEDGVGWRKVTAGKGSPGHNHREIPVESEVEAPDFKGTLFPKQDDDRMGIPERSAAIVFSVAGEGQMDIKLIFPLGTNPSEAADQPSLACMKALDLLVEDAKAKSDG